MVKQAIIYDYNALYYGYPIERLMERAGKGIAKELLKKYGQGKRIGFFCGPGNNGGDGLVTARYLLKNSQPEVYLIPAAKEIKTFAAQKNWQKFKGVKYERVRTGDIPNHFDIVVECLFGTGVKDKLKEPYGQIVKKLNSLKGKKVSVDLPVAGFKEDLVISLMTQKKSAGVVVDIGYPAHLKEKIGIGQVKALYQPAETSHKGDNGQLLIIGGSQKFHGAPLLAAKIASRIVDLVYFSSVPENNEIVKKMKSKLCDFIVVSRQEIKATVRKVDAVLIGPGLGMSQKNQTLVNDLLQKFPDKKFILDADALKILDKSLLGRNCLVTPHKKEFKQLFGLTPTKRNVEQAAKKYQCVIVLKGRIDYLANRQELKINTTGNAGMTKGGTGDVLAGLIGALACKNDLFLAGAAGVFLNGLAGDRLKERVSYYYNASDLVNEIPKAIKWSKDF